MDPQFRPPNIWPGPSSTKGVQDPAGPAYTFPDHPVRPMRPVVFDDTELIVKRRGIEGFNVGYAIGGGLALVGTHAGLPMSVFILLCLMTYAGGWLISHRRV